MKCHYHPDIESARNCNICSRNLCPTCSHLVKGRVFCQDCLVTGAELAAVAHGSPWADHSPRRAAFFALIPGLGAVYNRQYPKAVQHFGVFAALSVMANNVEILILANLAWWVFTIFDAYRSAQELVRRSITDPGSLETGSTQLDRKTVPLWGGLLILMGILFLAENLSPYFRLDRVVDQYWPVLLIAAGAYLIYDFYRSSNDPADPGHRPHAPHPSARPAQAAEPVHPPSAPEQTLGEQ